MMARDPRDTIVAGWREWVSLPEFDVPGIVAKLDTGAKTSAIHAFAQRTFTRDGGLWVSFSLHPVARRRQPVICCMARVHDTRRIRSSNGQVEERLVVRTPMSVCGRQWFIELTLTNRDAMGFRMLLGREALAGKLLVDSQKRFLLGKHEIGEFYPPATLTQKGCTP